MPTRSASTSRRPTRSTTRSLAVARQTDFRERPQAGDGVGRGARRAPARPRSRRCFRLNCPTGDARGGGARGRAGPLSGARRGARGHHRRRDPMADRATLLDEVDAARRGLPRRARRPSTPSRDGAGSDGRVERPRPRRARRRLVRARSRWRSPSSPAGRGDEFTYSKADTDGMNEADPVEATRADHAGEALRREEAAYARSARASRTGDVTSSRASRQRRHGRAGHPLRRPGPLRRACRPSPRLVRTGRRG